MRCISVSPNLKVLGSNILNVLHRLFGEMIQFDENSANGLTIQG